MELRSVRRHPVGAAANKFFLRLAMSQIRIKLRSPRVCERLMGAGEFKIAPPQNQALFVFRDPICPLVIDWITKHYTNPLMDELLRSRDLPQVSLIRDDDAIDLGD